MATAVRVLGYNIRSLRDDPAAVVRVVRGIGPDVVCLQEVPRFWGWRGRRRSLARDCGLVVAAGRRAAGLAVLAAPGVRQVAREFHLLARIPDLHRRALAIAVLEFVPPDAPPGAGPDARPEPTPGARPEAATGAGRDQPDGAVRLIVASTHLDLLDRPRLAHTRQVISLLDRAAGRYGAPVVLSGDINEEPGGAAWTLLAERFQDAHAVAPRGQERTFSARDPRRRIDGVFPDAGIEVVGCGVPDDAALAADYVLATDHRPVVADLRLP